MLKWISPMISRFKLLPRPRLFSVPGHVSANHDEPTFGQQLAERAASGVGSWAFIGAQATIMALWVLVNTLTFTGALHFDQYPFVFLNLAMSAEAAFTGPILLIAANVGALRDHAQADRIERLSNESEQLSAQNRDLVERLLAIEQMLDEHIGQSLQAHTAELRDLGALVRAVHAAVIPADGNGAATAGSPDAVPATVAVTSDAGIKPASRARRQDRSRAE